MPRFTCASGSPRLGRALHRVRYALRGSGGTSKGTSLLKAPSTGGLLRIWDELLRSYALSKSWLQIHRRKSVWNKGNGRPGCGDGAQSAERASAESAAGLSPTANSPGDLIQRHQTLSEPSVHTSKARWS